jgi:hypothetical protein
MSETMKIDVNTTSEVAIDMDFKYGQSGLRPSPRTMKTDNETEFYGMEIH